MKISVVVLAKNEAHQIRRCFDSLAALEPEFIVVDDESTDDTVKIAQEEYGAKIIHSKSEGNFDRQRNKGIEAATGKWVIQTAPDEVWVPQTIQKMKELFLWGLPLEDAYMIERCECVFERPISHLKPRHEIRVLRKGKCRYTGSKIHETLEVDGVVGRVMGKVNHYNIQDLAKTISKINFYTTIEAKEDYRTNGHEQAKKYRKGLVSKSAKRFFKHYVKERACFSGLYGFVWAFVHVLNGVVHRLKVIELDLKQHKE